MGPFRVVRFMVSPNFRHKNSSNNTVFKYFQQVGLVTNSLTFQTANHQVISYFFACTNIQLVDESTKSLLRFWTRLSQKRGFIFFSIPFQLINLISSFENQLLYRYIHDCVYIYIYIGSYMLHVTFLHTPKKSICCKKGIYTNFVRNTD